MIYKRTNFYITGLFLNPYIEEKISKDFFTNVDDKLKKLLEQIDFFQKTKRHMIYVFCVFYDEWKGVEPTDLTDLVDFFNKPAIEMTLYFNIASNLNEITTQELQIAILNKLFPRMFVMFDYYKLNIEPLHALVEQFRNEL
jgi:hypothetical protein